MTELSPARLLVIDAPDGDAELLVNQLRDAGMPLRIHSVTNTAAFEEALNEQKFDLAIMIPPNPVGDIEELAAALAQHKTRLLVCGLNFTGSHHTTAMRAGAADLVPLDDRDRIVAVVRRELEHARLGAQVGSLAARTEDAEARARLLLDTTPLAIAYVHDGMHLAANQRYLDLFGIADAEELSVMPLLDIVASSGQEAFRQTLRAIQTGASGPFTLLGQRGQESFSATLSVTHCTFENEPCWQIAVQPENERPRGASAEFAVAGSEIPTLNDAAESTDKPADEPPVLEDVFGINPADLDPISGLTHRDRFLSDLDTHLEHHKAASLIAVAIDHFASLRAKLGIDEADLLIADTSGLLNESLARFTTTDYGLARFSEDTFVVLLDPIDQAALQKLTFNLRAAIDRHEFEQSLSLAEVNFSLLAGNVEPSTSNARQAMNQLLRAFETQRQDKQHKFTTILANFSARPRKVEQGDSQTLQRIERALREESFILLFQPIISLRGESDEHYEVFVRMPGAGKDSELTTADQFIDLAEQAHVAGKVDRWVILQAVKLLSTHRSKGHDTRLTINLSADSTIDSNFLPWLGVAIRAARLPSDALVFQFREQHIVDHPMEARALARGLTELNCRVSVSRFGASSTSLNAIRGLHIDFVKLDPALIDEVVATPAKRDDLSKLISTLQTQGKLTIVPMVESANLLAALWQAGANFIQGHYLQEPSTDMDYDFTANEAF